MRNLLAVAIVGLVVYTIFDVLRSEADERFGLSRALWILLIVVVPVLGSIAWLVARRQARARGAGGSGSGGTRPGPSPRGPRRPSGPVAPDDDPEFLWRLAQQQRRAQRERGTGGTPPASTDASPTDADGDTA
jgi:Phospholipase_D-nuclease N-terminal